MTTGIDMDALLVDAARKYGLDPDRPSEFASTYTRSLITQIGPVIIYPELARTDVQWIAAVLDALSRAAQTVAADPDTWHAEIDGDRVHLHGSLLTARGATVGVEASLLPRLLALLKQVTTDPAHIALRQDGTAGPEWTWALVLRGGMVYAHAPRPEQPTFPLSLDGWEPVSTVTVDLNGIARLAEVLGTARGYGPARAPRAPEGTL